MLLVTEAFVEICSATVCGTVLKLLDISEGTSVTSHPETRLLLSCTETNVPPVYMRYIPAARQLQRTYNSYACTRQY